MREARTRALELKKKKTTQKLPVPVPKKTSEKMAAPKPATMAPPPKMNFSSDSNLSEDLREFERDLCSESDQEGQRDESNGTIYVQETSSGKIFRT